MTTVLSRTDSLPDRPDRSATQRDDRRSAPRYRFTGTVELLDPQSGRKIVSMTSDLSRYGCYVNTNTPFEEATPVKLAITYRGATFRADAVVAHSVRNQGMGVSFAAIDTAEQIILQEWLTQASDQALEHRPSQINPARARAGRGLFVFLAVVAFAALTIVTLVLLGLV
jgi:hypothetical protein